MVNRSEQTQLSDDRSISQNYQSVPAREVQESPERVLNGGGPAGVMEGLFRCVPEHRFFFRASPEGMEEKEKSQQATTSLFLQIPARHSTSRAVGQRYQSKRKKLHNTIIILAIIII